MAILETALFEMSLNRFCTTRLDGLVHLAEVNPRHTGPALDDTGSELSYDGPATFVQGIR